MQRFGWFLFGLLVVGVIGASAAGQVAGRYTAARARPTLVSPPATGRPSMAAGQKAAPLPTPLASSTPSTLDKDSAVVAAIEKVSPAVVSIVDATSGQGGTPRAADPPARGSGVIIDPQGYIVTNDRVVAGAQTLQVVLADGSRRSARLVGGDPIADIAVLQVGGALPEVAEFGDSDALVPGQVVIAMGMSPDTVTVGVVSALNCAAGDRQGMIGTDAEIDNGNAGGPLVNSIGQVIGINTLIVPHALNRNTNGRQGLAVPAGLVRQIAAQVILSGHVEHPYIGIRYRTLDPQLASAWDLAVNEGVVVTQVDAGSPADDAGLQPKDVIRALNGQPLDQEHTLLSALFFHLPGDHVSLTVQRGSQQLEITLVLSTHPDSRPDPGSDIG